MQTAIIKFVVGCYLGACIEGYQGIPRGYCGVGRPIYGLGLLLASKSFFANILKVFLLEYCGSLFFDKGKKLWDYSNKKLNMNGRVCVENLLAFAALGSIGARLPLSVLGTATAVLLMGGMNDNNSRLFTN